MKYKILNTLKDGTTYDVTPLVSSINWGGDINQAARKLNVNMAYSRDSYLPKYNTPLGSMLMLRNGTQELMRGIVFDVKKDTGGLSRVVSHDHLIYLLKSKGTYKFKNMTADAIIKKMCKDFNIPIGNIPSTGVNLPKLILRQQKIYNICIIALTETMKRNGKKYMLRMIEGKLHVIEKAKQTVRWLITEGSNLSSATYSENINDMHNQVVIVGDKDQVLATVENSELIKQYGVLQELKQESDVSKSTARQIAKNMLEELGRVSREASINCLGLDDVEAGTAIEVKESLTGLNGTFYVASDDHTVENGQHTMKLKLNWTDEVATKEAPQTNE